MKGQYVYFEVYQKTHTCFSAKRGAVLLPSQTLAGTYTNMPHCELKGEPPRLQTGSLGCELSRSKYASVVWAFHFTITKGFWKWLLR